MSGAYGRDSPTGPFSIPPGGVLSVPLAFVCGENLHTDPNNAARYLPHDPETYKNNLDFSDLVKNATWAEWIYDNPGYDTDGDGDETTGWVIFYLHLATRDRAPLGTVVLAGEPVGHPSCEGGTSTGSHIHIARKFNGEWIAADGPMPFTMSDWVAQAGFRPFEGSLSRGDQVVIANPLSPAQAFISLSAHDLLLNPKISHDLWWEE